jgi:putative endonuclease
VNIGSQEPDSLSVEPEQTWVLYMLRCADNSLYTGITTDIERRLREHSGLAGKSKGAKALRGKRPLSLVFQIALQNKSEALKLEYRIKTLTRAQKESLLDGGLELGTLSDSLIVNELLST